MPSLVAAILAACVVGSYAAGGSADGGLAPALHALVAMVVVVPPALLSLLAFLVVRASTRARWSAVAADGVGWLAGAAATGALFYLAFDEDPQLHGVGASLALFAVPYLVALAVYLKVGPREFGRGVVGVAVLASGVVVAVAVVRGLAA